MRRQTQMLQGQRASALGLREVLTVVEEHLAAGPDSSEAPGRRVAIAAVVANPLAGRYEEDLAELVKLGGELGRYLVERVLTLADRAEIVSVGRAAIVGQDGEVEHAAALVGPSFSAAVRKSIGTWRPLTPSAKRIGGPGSIAAVTLDHLEGVPAEMAQPLPPMEIRVPEHPRDDEAIVILAVGGPLTLGLAGSSA